MRIVVTGRRRGAERFLLVEGPEGTTAGDVLAELGEVGTPVSHARPLRHGDDLHGPPPSGPPTAGGPWVVVAEGPDAGRTAPLRPGRWVTVGRDPSCELPVADAALSRRHARIRLERDGVRVEDLGSTNGVRWESARDGPGPAGRAAPGDLWSEDDRLLVGGSALSLVTRPPAPARVTTADGLDHVAPWPRPRWAPGELRLAGPSPPVLRRVRRPSAWTWALPLAAAAAVALVLRMPWLLLFGLLGPAMVLGAHLAERRTAREEFEEASAAFAESRAALDLRARRARAEELHGLRRRDPGVAGVAATLACGPAVAGDVWDCGEEPPRVVVGSGPVRSAVTVDDEVHVHASAPVVVSLDHPVVVVGDPRLREALARSLLLQVACRHPPSQVALEGPAPEAVTQDALGELLAWLPHSWREALRTASRVLRWDRDVLLLDELREVPLGTTVIHVRSEVEAAVHPPDGPPRACVPTLLGRSTARRMARRLAPLRVGAGRGGARAGRHAGAPSFADLVGWPRGDGEVAAGWSRPGTDVVLGVDAGGAPVVVDLVTDGPHALVAGTTGSGKSELLRTLVAALAMRCSPADLALLLVDYKGGSSLGECARLPHVTGVVTDLDPHLASRVLVSLQAEITRREAVLHAAGARDVRDYRGADLPRLVVVVDEFRVLAEEVPEVLTGLVRVAAVGRSLGVHLVLATQRPAGIVGADLRANVNLRIALRVRDAADSHDVLDCADAAALPEGRPGLALVRTGADAPRLLQVARLTRPGTAGPQEGVLRVQEHHDLASARRALDAEDRQEDDEGGVDELAALLTQVARARGLTAPVVWLPPLPGRVGPGAAEDGSWAVLDRPEEQRREEIPWAPRSHLCLVGSARSGRSTAVRSVLSRLAGAWVVAFDLGGALGDDPVLRDAAACCAWVGPDETAHGLRVLELLQEVVLRRRSGRDGAADPVVLVIDGWDRFVDEYGEADRGRGVETALRLLREGPAVGVVVLVTGDRSLLVGRVAGLLPQTWALPLNDPSDLLLTGLRAAQVPRDRPPGRLVGVRDGAVGQVVLPHPGRGPGAPPGGPPLRCRPLPRAWSSEDAPGRTAGVWALGGDEAAPVPAPRGTVLVLGPAGSGRSWTLDVLASRRDGPTLRVDGADPPAEEPLRAQLVGGTPPPTLVVDDAHLLAGTAVEELLVDAAARGCAVLVAADLDLAAGSFRGLLPAAARARTAVVLQPTTPGQGAVVGAQLPVGDLRIPGRGVLVHRGRCTRLQVVSPPASP